MSDPTDLVTCASATRPAMPTPDTIVREVDTGRVLRWTGRDWVDDIVAWVERAFDRAEQQARDAMGDPDDGDPWDDPNGEFQSRGGPVFDHVVAHGPQWRLADIARKRRIVAEHDTDKRWPLDRSRVGCRTCDLRGDIAVDDEWPCLTLRLLAEEFASEPGYDAQRWRP